MGNRIPVLTADCAGGLTIRCEVYSCYSYL
jgi:hypothetical protein